MSHLRVHAALRMSAAGRIRQAAAGVLVLALVLLVHPLMLIPVVLVLFFVDAYLFGEMLVLGIPFNKCVPPCGVGVPEEG